MGSDQGKQYQRIGDAAKALNLKTCVLRFWEDEFPQLHPHRTPKGQRLYSDEDMDLLFRIRSLLHEQGMTIDGARRVLSGKQPLPVQAPPEPDPAMPPSCNPRQAAVLAEAVSELRSLRELLNNPHGSFSASSLPSSNPCTTETLGDLAPSGPGSSFASGPSRPSTRPVLPGLTLWEK